MALFSLPPSAIYSVIIFGDVIGQRSTYKVGLLTILCDTLYVSFYPLSHFLFNVYPRKLPSAPCFCVLEAQI
jgi:hypothetical protein